MSISEDINRMLSMRRPIRICIQGKERLTINPVGTDRWEIRKTIPKTAHIYRDVCFREECDPASGIRTLSLWTDGTFNWMQNAEFASYEVVA